jgi:hypothetical protein
VKIGNDMVYDGPDRQILMLKDITDWFGNFADNNTSKD